MRLALLLSFLAGLLPAQEKLQVVTTMNFLRGIAQEVGGDRVVARSLAHPREDPHFVQPKPTLMKRARGADVLIEVGLSLELWIKRVTDGAGNPRIERGARGRIVAGRGIRTRQKPREVSRIHGDVHPEGNPHVWTDPLNVRRMVVNIARGLGRVDPAHEEEYQKRGEAYIRRLDEAMFGKEVVGKLGGEELVRLLQGGGLRAALEKQEIAPGGWLGRAAALAGTPVITYHRNWSYFAARFGLDVVGEIEVKPGIPPTPGHRRDTIRIGKQRQVKVVLSAIYYPRRASQDVAEAIGARAVVLPMDTGAVDGVDDYVQLVDYWLSQITTAVRG